MGIVIMPSPSAFARLVTNMLTGLVQSLLWYLPYYMTVQCSVFSFLVYSVGGEGTLVDFTLR